jgi:hypothetical protein
VETPVVGLAWSSSILLVLIRCEKFERRFQEVSYALNLGLFLANTSVQTVGLRLVGVARDPDDTHAYAMVEVHTMRWMT